MSASLLRQTRRPGRIGWTDILAMAISRWAWC